jgi:hypothetical protein
VPASDSQNDATFIQQSTGHATFGTATGDGIKGNIKDWNTSTKVVLMNPPYLLLKFIGKSFGSPVQICTKYCQTGYTYRCHPVYQSGGAIYDWIHVQCISASKETFVIPCWLAAVVVLADSLEPYRLLVKWAKRVSYWHQLSFF